MKLNYILNKGVIIFKRIVINSFFTTLATLSFVNVIYSSEADSRKSSPEFFSKKLATRVYQRDWANVPKEKKFGLEANLRYLIYIDDKMRGIDKDEQVKEEYKKNWYSHLEEMEKMKGELKKTDDLGKLSRLHRGLLFRGPGRRLVQRLISSPKEEETLMLNNENFSFKTEEELLACMDFSIQSLKEDDPISNLDETRKLFSRYRSFFTIDDEEQFSEKVKSWDPKTPKDFLWAGDASQVLFLQTRLGFVPVSNLSTEDLLNLIYLGVRNDFK